MLGADAPRFPASKIELTFWMMLSASLVFLGPG